MNHLLSEFKKAKHHRHYFPSLYILTLALCFLLCGCSKNTASTEAESAGSVTDSSASAADSSASDNLTKSPSSGRIQEDGSRDNTPMVYEPSADGRLVFENEYGAIDASNVSQGYVMAKFTAENEKIKFQISGPDSVTYTYALQSGDDWAVFPLSAGDGQYGFLLLENIEGDSYGVDMSETVDVQLEDANLPFLYPNQYVSFTADSETVAEGAELAKDAASDLDVIENVYNYVTEHIHYDTEKARNLSYGYIPDCDETLKTQTGICFDYASVMCAMLRTQSIPSKLQVGYSGEVYHAWISTYIDDIGWVDNMIEFDGHDWQLLDPTLGASNDAKDAASYMGDGSNYLVKYNY